jgi:hypothetical protein
MLATALVEKCRRRYAVEMQQNINEYIKEYSSRQRRGGRGKREARGTEETRKA